MSQAQIRILAVDDHRLRRAGIAGLISDEPRRDRPFPDRTRAAVLGIKRGIIS